MVMQHLAHTDVLAYKHRHACIARSPSSLHFTCKLTSTKLLVSKFLPIHKITRRTPSKLPDVVKQECQNPSKSCSICCSTSKTAGDCVPLLYWTKHIVHNSDQNWRKHKQAKVSLTKGTSAVRGKTLSATCLSHCN
jgi:hypothetical protein